MGVLRGPDIVTDGLILYLDAGNFKSYPGSGSVWYDLSGNRYNGELINMPTYSSNNKGYLEFNGTNQHITNFPEFPSITNEPLSVFAWVWSDYTLDGADDGIWGYINSSTDNCHFEISNNSMRLRLGDVNRTGMTMLPQNQWIYVGFTSSGNSHKFYINNDVEDSWSGNTGTILGTHNDSIGMYVGNSTTVRPWEGRIGMIKVYYKELTSTEVLQNYNATKGRYL